VPAEPPPVPDRLTRGDPATGRPDRLVLVIGTGTEVGKTWVSAALLRSLAAGGHRVAARKPAQSFDPADPPAATDAAVLARATGQRPEAVCPTERWYPVAMAPPMAAEVLGRPSFTVAQLAAELDWGAGVAMAVGLVETAGGVRSPQAADGDAVDLGRLLRPDLVVLVADAGLGTINGVRLAVEALAGVPAPVVVVLNRFDPADDLHCRNRAWLADRDGLAVLVTPGGEGELGRLALQCPPGGDAVDQVNGTDDRGGGGRHWGEVVTSTVEKPQAGDLVVSPELGVTAGPLVGSDESTPLEEDEPEGIIPASPLWAMKMRRHIQWHLLPSHERHERIRDKLGSGDETVYVIDDGRHHVMVGRRIGGRAGEIEYALVGRAPRDRYDDLLAGRLAPLRAFDGATGLTLCGIAAEEAILSSNLFDVDHYAELADVPTEYRPGSPYVELTEDLEIPID
jgi:dethiobiotin synthetase